MKIEITYDPLNGHVISDGRIPEYINNLVEKYKQKDSSDIVLCIGSELMIHAIRVAIKKGQFYFEDIVFKFNGEVVTMNKDARPQRWPDGFCDNFEHFLALILGWEP